ncbi:PREDICTED: transmembrane anterior posterior transformation protein 1 homolog [Acropora digitifera]|uniref:transmembrane anterior posterior transformation protein 1 homolog n=1 Tax=Acropora digitifera TaxID=70779 RepID=UPI00077ACE6A|nr:PREDICTED: transmembrane anterior posterior transformation protein 1 homolog [Acropora digitifera]
MAETHCKEEEQIKDFALPNSYSCDVDEEVVICRDVVDTYLNPKVEESVENGSEIEFNNLDNNDDLNKYGHIEPIQLEDRCSFSRDQESVRNEILERIDSDALHHTCSDPFQNERLSDLLNSRIGKSPEMEFRHRNTNVEKLIPGDGDTGSLQTSEHFSELVQGEEKAEENNTDGPQSKEEGSEQRFPGGMKNLSFMNYFMAEISRGKHLELEEDKYSEKREKVYTFMKIPREFEKLMVFGFMLCLDCFLFMFTILPLRLIVAVYKITTGLLFCRISRMLQPGQICDLLKGMLYLFDNNTNCVNPFTPFVELKGSVFKKFEKNNLFQMACSDIRERFHYIILISIVALRNLTEFNWNLDHLYVICPYLFAVLLSEYFVDWIKHAFITKFNNIPVEVYSEYRELLAEDATSSRQKNAHADHFDLVSRRMGFIPLPLGSLVIRVITQSVKLHGAAGICLLLVTFIFLTSVKILNSIIFLGKATQYVKTKNDHGGSSSTEASGKNPVASKHKLQPQFSVTFLESEQTSNVSLIGENRQATEQVDTDTGKIKQPRQKTLAEINRYTLCNKEIVVF